jgi:hypothetical protein
MTTSKLPIGTDNDNGLYQRYSITNINKNSFRIKDGARLFRRFARLAIDNWNNYLQSHTVLSLPRSERTQ